MDQIEILDALPGTGKTHTVIEWMHKNPTKRYLYVSPLISEIEERIVPECEALDFKYPESNGTTTKSDHLLELLEEGHNIAFTHSLYARMTYAHIETIRVFGYILIVDEEVSVIEPLTNSSGGRSGYGYTGSDLKYLYNDSRVTVDKEDLGRLVWAWDNYGEGAKYSRLKSMCDLKMIYCADSRKDKLGNVIDEIHSLVIQLPLGLLEACERVILISYMFEGSIMDSFLKLKKIPTILFDLGSEGVSLRYHSSEIKSMVRPLINMVSTHSTEKIGRKRLTYTWYTKEFNRQDARDIAAAIRSVGRECNVKAADLMWTAPKDRVIGSRSGGNYIRPIGYAQSKSFVYCSARATNDYAHKSTLVHALYRHPNLTVDTYLKHYGIHIDVDVFATSELVQWIWRSRIRNKEPINLCILSYRMRQLFLLWLDAV